MIVHQTKLRIRYAETDKMGYAYYGNYATYFEVARVEMLRSLGISYREMEDHGVMLPVLDFKIKYFKPAFYDDEIRIETTVRKIPDTRIHFEYATFLNDKQLNKAETTLVFVSIKTGRPIQMPEELAKVFREKFTEQTE